MCTLKYVALLLERDEIDEKAGQNFADYVCSCVLSRVYRVGHARRDKDDG